MREEAQNEAAISHDWQDVVHQHLITPAIVIDSTTASTTAPTNSTPDKFMHRWLAVRHERMPQLAEEITLTPKLERLIHILDWVRIEEFVAASCITDAGQPMAGRGGQLQRLNLSPAWFQ